MTVRARPGLVSEVKPKERLDEHGATARSIISI